MLKAGYVLCRRCGHATDDAYYYNGELNVWVQLRRRSGRRFLVEIYTPAYQQNAEGVAVTHCALSDANLLGKVGIPHQIMVECRIADQQKAYKFTRACPFCVGKQPGWESVQELIPGVGNLPAYIVAVIGARTVGKSCWIAAMSCLHNLNKLTSQQQPDGEHHRYVLVPDQLEDAADHPPEATPINAVGNTRCLTIAERTENGTKDVAQILLLDFAGELFAKDKEMEFKNSAAHIFNGGKGYTGVDAVVFMMDPTDLKPSAKTGAYSIATTYNRVNDELKLLFNRPVAFVLNKIDTLFHQSVEEISGQAPGIPVPWITEDTFAYQGNAMYLKDAIKPRVALQMSLFARANALVKGVCDRTDASAFLIKTATPYQDKDGNEFLNFQEGINVLDPLLWILNMLDIFPIDDIL